MGPFEKDFRVSNRRRVRRREAKEPTSIDGTEAKPEPTADAAPAGEVGPADEPEDRGWRGTVEETASSISDAAKSGRDVIGGMTEAATRSTKALGGTAIDAVGRASGAAARAGKAASEATASAGRRAAAASASAGRRASGATVAMAGMIRSRSVGAAAPIANRLSEMTQNLLATSVSSDINGLVQELVKGPATIYDKAMDKLFLETGIGGGNHRMFDEGHTLLGAWRAARDASDDDTIHAEVTGFLAGLLKDASTAKGLPFFTWDKERFTEIADYLKDELGIPKDWFYDLNSYDTAELLGATIATMVLVFRWHEADAEEFARLAAGLAVSGAVAANPLALVVSVVALARAFHLARESGDYGALADGIAKGAVVSGTTITAVAVVGATDAAVPGLGLLVGIATGVLAHKATERVSVSEIGEFVARRAMAAARDVKAMAEAQLATRTSTDAPALKGDVA